VIDPGYGGNDADIEIGEIPDSPSGDTPSPSPGGTSNYNDLINKPSINNVTLSGNKTGSQLGLISEADLSDKLVALGIRPVAIYYDTTANWNSQVSLVSERNAVYIYTDYQQSGNLDLAGFKIGNGNAYVVDLPFTDKLYKQHINDSTIHITQTEREFWNNKNRAYLSLTEDETLVLTTN